MKKKHVYDICVAGGAGHVGLPLATVFAAKGFKTLAYDVNAEALSKVSAGKFPFMEESGETHLKCVLRSKRLSLSSSASDIAAAKTIVITIGTPVDEFMNPDTGVMRRFIDGLFPYLKRGQLLILRSTVYPGTTAWLHNYLRSKGKPLAVAFCPERVVQGRAIEELRSLPQIVSGAVPAAENAAAAVFKKIAPSIVRLAPMEAEFAKLFNNAYRYIEFAITNQFYMMANSAGLDYGRILDGMKKNYPRAAAIPRAGFAAGPCLLKDTMQLAAFSDNQFSLGHLAMNLNEGLVLYLVGQLKKKLDLKGKTVGLLGMAFKADSDDTRSSLSYKLKKVLQFHARRVLTTDPHVTTDSELVPLERAVRESDVLVLCVPHSAYRELKLRGKTVLDLWGFFGKGTRL